MHVVQQKAVHCYDNAKNEWTADAIPHKLQLKQSFEVYSSCELQVLPTRDSRPSRSCTASTKHSTTAAKEENSYTCRTRLVGRSNLNPL